MNASQTWTLDYVIELSYQDFFDIPESVEVKK